MRARKESKIGRYRKREIPNEIAFPIPAGNLHLQRGRGESTKYVKKIDDFLENQIPGK